MSSLDLALVGNGWVSALIDEQASVVWCCLPRLDGDPVFCSLLAGDDSAERPGRFDIQLEGAVRSEQAYLADTPILVSRFYDAAGSAIEITDFCPRFGVEGAIDCSPMLVRQVSPIAGKPSIRVNLEAAINYGCDARTPSASNGAISYAGEPLLRLNTNAPIKLVLAHEPIAVDKPLTFVVGSYEPIEGDIGIFGEKLLELTTNYWLNWVDALKTPAEFHDAVVRAAITLELHVYEHTGAIIASTTTSIPEAPNSGRNWDYRYCWPRDAYFTADALCSVGAVRAIERYLAFLLDIAKRSIKAKLVPIYNIDGDSIPHEHIADCLPGYRGMGPVRIGNKASEQNQNDLYGEAVLTAEAMFTERGTSRVGDEGLLRQLERFGEHAAELYNQPDAGLWELRGAGRVHTFSSVMCWVACDRLARYAETVGLADRAEYWRANASRIREEIWRRSWNEKLNAFTAAMDGESLDASLLLMPRLGFINARDPRFVGTVEAIERDLKHGDFIYRYVERDDFGYPENSFLVCTFWYIEALARMGGKRRAEARALFDKVLSARNRHGMLSEDLDPRTLELWGNFPQTYCMAGIIECAMALAEDVGVA
ncbi:MAG TPA: glycoside hydrolase family 15 protein [Gemmatimonadaceae bacterium]|nr:glycoside hydrolase family 15 protein [Gemmatimonadaceae bacterium]